MKNTVLLLALAAALLCIPTSSLLYAAPKLAPERAVFKVLKVFAAQDGPYRYRSYVIEYQGQEVVVEDRLLQTAYRTDDNITVLVMRHSHPNPIDSHGLLHFSVVPTRKR